MEENKDLAPEAEKSTYRLKSDIDTPQEELVALRASNKRKNMLLVITALFIIALGGVLWWVLAHQN
jgi:membrane protein insertase Oxa1/YidC/SpoIIIJ